MRTADLPEFGAVLQRLGRIFGRELDRDLVGDYFRALEDVPLRRIQENAEAHIRERQHFPRPRELRYPPDGELRRPPTQALAPPPQQCDWQALGNRWLLGYLMRRGTEGRPVADGRLAALTEEKRRIAADMASWPGGGPSPEEQRHIRACAVARFAELAEARP